jgi:hypothetical protein
LCRKLGNNVLSIDDKDVPGGAWVTKKYKDLPEVEIGCHIWSYNKEVYKWLENFFELDLVPHQSSPKIVYKKRFIAYDFKANVITAKAVLINVAKLNVTFFKNFRKRPDLRISIFPANYKYPKNGAKDVYDAVKRKIEKHQLDLLLSRKVEKVVLEKKGGKLLMSNGETVSFSEELVLSSLSNIKQYIFEDGTTLEPLLREVNYIHKHLMIKGTQNKKFSYLRLMNNELIHRVSDMTSQVKGKLPGNAFLICVGIHEKAYAENSKSDQETKILNTLIDLKLFKSDAEIVLSDSNVFPSFYNEISKIKEIEKRSNGKIRFLRSTDLIYSFHNKMEQYQTLLD